MIDPKILRNETQKVRDMIQARGVDFDIDRLLELDKRRREAMVKTDQLRKKRNDLSVQIGQQKKKAAQKGEQDTNINSMLDEMKKISQDLESFEKELKDTEKEYNAMLRAMPNLLAESVPFGKDDTYNKQIRTWGKFPEFDFVPKDHVEITHNLDLVDLERAAKVSGSRFYYLKNELVTLNQALLRFALDLLEKRGYTPVQTPFMINRDSMEGAVIAEDFEDVIYKIQDEDLYLIGTSEHALVSMHKNEILDGKTLPIRYAGTSPCFRKEAGAHGKDQKGIFRVHQFEKVEQLVFSRPEDSWKEHENMLSIAEEFYQKIGIPYRVMLLSSGDVGKASAKTYDLEAWMPGQNAYREIVSCSNCLDFQARRLKIRFRDKTNEDTQYLHTLNSTLVATSRTMVSILENFQTRDGHISIPTPLKGFIGKDMISDNDSKKDINDSNDNDDTP